MGNAAAAKDLGEWGTEAHSDRNDRDRWGRRAMGLVQARDDSRLREQVARRDGLNINYTCERWDCGRDMGLRGRG